MSIMFLNYLVNIALALIVPESKLFALLEGQAEFFQIFAQPIGIVGGVALSAGYCKEFFSGFGAAFAALAYFYDPGELAEIEFIVLFLVIAAQKFA